MSWQSQWRDIYDLPYDARIRLVYGNLTDRYNEWVAEGKVDSFYLPHSKPSQVRAIKYLRNADKKRLVILRATDYYTFVPDVGYKAKHHKTNEDVYVVQHDSRLPNTRTDDRPQEYLTVVKKFDKGYWYSKDEMEERERKFLDVVLSRQSHVQKRYIDKLTTKQKQALALLKIMDVDGYIDGVGYRKKYNKYTGWDEFQRKALYEDVILYFIDAVPEDEQ